MHLDFSSLSGGNPLASPLQRDSSASLSRLSGRKVLVVEDEALVGMDLCMALDDIKATALGPVMHLQEAIATCRTENFDAAILDVDLNGQEVFEAAELLIARRIPFVFHTGHFDRADLFEQFEDVPVCSKPIRSQRLLSVVASLLPPEPVLH